MAKKLVKDVTPLLMLVMTQREVLKKLSKECAYCYRLDHYDSWAYELEGGSTMKRSSLCLCLLAVGVLTVFFSAISCDACNFLYDTPTGNTWQLMEKNVHDLMNQLPADGGPRSSAEAQHRGISCIRSLTYTGGA
jgi:hypothetical protein